MSDPDKPLRAALEDRLRFETLVSDLSSRFVNLEPDQVDGAIQEAAIGAPGSANGRAFSPEAICSECARDKNPNDIRS